MTQQQGTCIVVGVETQIGLAIIRELGMAGVRVIALSHDTNALGLCSRYVSHARVVTPRSPALLEVLRELGEQFGDCSLIMVSESNLQWLTEQRRQLSPRIHPALPPPQALALVLDKQQTLAAARRLGIPVPLTELPQSRADIERIAAEFPFPAVLKWPDPAAVGAALSRLGLPLIKAEYVYDAAGLRDVAERYAAVGAWPLIQQYCRGQGLGQFFFVHQGRVRQRFQHLRIAEWPPEGGFSSVCDSLPLRLHQDLQRQSEALLLAIGWEGVAMVEYRLDADNGQAWLMEINGRFWGSFPLAMHCGAGFALLTHRAALGLPLGEPAPPQAGRRCRMVLTELKRLVRLLLQPERIADRQFRIRPAHELARFAADFLRPGVCYFLWSWRDPKPWFGDLRNMLVKLLGRPSTR
jgi:predicted ATP-grasp superfamily ATP-dependent carboligase